MNEASCSAPLVTCRFSTMSRYEGSASAMPMPSNTTVIKTSTRVKPLLRELPGAAPLERMLRILLIIASILRLIPSHPETVHILTEIVTCCRKWSTFQKGLLTVYRLETKTAPGGGGFTASTTQASGRINLFKRQGGVHETSSVTQMWNGPPLAGRLK